MVISSRKGKEGFWIGPQTFFACILHPANTPLYIPSKLLANISNSTLQRFNLHSKSAPNKGS